MSKILEKFEYIKSHMLEDMVVRLDIDKPQPWVDSEYRAQHVFISKGKTNVAGKTSDAFSKAKRMYQFPSNVD